MRHIISGYKFVSEILTAMDKRNLSLISAGVAFYAMLAIFPALAALIALWGVFADPLVIDEQLNLLKQFAPADAFRLVDTQVNALINANDSTLGYTTLVSLGAALWSTRAGVAALIRGLNAVYSAPHRTGIRRTFAALLLTLCLIGMSLVALTGIVIFPIALALLPLGEFTQDIFTTLRWVLVTLAVILGLGLIYRFGPNHKTDYLKTNWISPGALVALFIWGAVSWAFSLYLANFGKYNEVYGSIGAVVALLMWFYISAWVVLLGATLNCELARRRHDRQAEPQAT
ncbi:YihY/virulence factor BrkB family protein [Litoreibacter arenae]|uniref:Inner membrane protein YihY, formerly thought to be RNase BN n=1 Tax=Litoreibacter arenae DSM 19593 TaxID=1123360 RepID=S9Q8Q9_9RHOB|nr:YihY/virulence factor BrkB family protein [Litoreibacter arenae]EPX77766.1 Inner membrane protein YihY, formerly thought to be RNase BN [Litoreibacter arenae DSM 19593]